MLTNERLMEIAKRQCPVIDSFMMTHDDIVAAMQLALMEAHANATPDDFTTAECAQVLIDMAIQRGEVVTIRLVSDYPPRMGAYLMVPEVRKAVKKD